MYGKLPVKQWSLPLGNSMTLDDKDEINPEHVKLFGLNVRGIENGIKNLKMQKVLFIEVIMKFIINILVDITIAPVIHVFA